VGGDIIIILDIERTAEKHICTHLNTFHKQLEFKPTEKENGRTDYQDLTINRHTKHTAL
jgi:hypothetical protein